MHRTTLFRIIGFVCLACLPALLMPDYADAKPKSERAVVKTSLENAEGEFVAILVNGRTLTGPNSSGQRRDGRILMPVMAVARGLGDSANVDAASRIITVRRQTGTTAKFDARLGQVYENGSLVLSVSSTSEIIFTANADELLLPVEIVAALFDAAIRYDSRQNTLIVARGQVQKETLPNDTGRRSAELYQVDYDYSLNRYSSAASQNLVLTATGRLGDGRFNFTSNSSSSSFRKINLRNGTFTLDRPNGQRFAVGDFGTGSSLQLSAANVRGGMASVPVGIVTINAFAGRTTSGTVFYAPISILPDDDPRVPPPVRRSSRYDTSVMGFSAAASPATGSRRFKSLLLSAGAMRFNGPNRSGEVASASANYGGSRIRLQGEAAIGRFNKISSDNSRVDAFASALDISGTVQLTDNLSVQARYTFIGRNFLSPQSGMREPIDLKAAGITWSPTKWLSASVNASTIRRPGAAAKLDKSITTGFSVTPGGSAPRFYFSHTQNSSTQVRSAAFSLFNASKEFSRWRLFVNATRVAGLGPATVNTQIGANFRLNDSNTFEVSQGVGNRRSYNGQFDWRTSNLVSRRLSLSAGAGYNYTQSSKVSTFGRLSAALKLPRQSSLQVSYIQSNAGPTLMISVRGTLFRRREAAGFLNAQVSEINSFSTVRGRVYQDINLNGRFDDGVDQPQANVKVRVDGNRYVMSDSIGAFRFDSVTAGDHKVYLDLLSVRADLTLLGNGAQTAAIAAGRDSIIDFRLVRTGRISGRVWLDINENGKLDEGETPLADIRVVTASGRDTLTDADGYFVIGDLAPGEHVIFIDEKTLPEKTKASFAPRAMQVSPGQETANVGLAAIMIPAEVKHFGAKPRP